MTLIFNLDIKEFEASLKLVIPLDGIMTPNSDERFPRRTKADFKLKLNSNGIKKYRHISGYNPGIYELNSSLEINKFGESDTV